MDFNLTLEEGAYLVKLARRTIETKLYNERLTEPLDSSKRLNKYSGVFVTINTIKGSERRLRGCIGYPYPVKPLKDAVIDSAVSAAFRDPRFKPVSTEETDSIVLEVSILTPPELIKVEKPEKYPDYIEIGRDGLIIRRGGKNGLLLPQVPVEFEWDAEEFLTQCCLKAGLSLDAWLLPGTEISKFSAIIFYEETPRGKVKRKELQNQ